MHEPQQLRTLIVDDEPLARDGIRMLLENDPEIVVLDECASGRAAVQAIQQLRPDLVFLDIQMPEMNGFEVMAALNPDEVPAIVFVTAYDSFALRAFEVHALDYLLKPYDDERFHTAVRRAKQHLARSRVNNLSQRLISLLETYGDAAAFGDLRPKTNAPPVKPTEDRYLSRLVIRDAGRVVFLRMNEIDWIEAADYYVQIHAGDKTYLHRESMNNLEERLDPACFLRAHRSAIVNCERITGLRSQGRRDLLVVLSTGVELRVGRSYREKIQALCQSR